MNTCVHKTRSQRNSNGKKAKATGIDRELSGQLVCRITSCVSCYSTIINMGSSFTTTSWCPVVLLFHSDSSAFTRRLLTNKTIILLICYCYRVELRSVLPWKRSWTHLQQWGYSQSCCSTTLEFWPIRIQQYCEWVHVIPLSLFLDKHIMSFPVRSRGLWEITGSCVCVSSNRATLYSQNHINTHLIV